MVELARRSFLAGLGAALITAPAIVRVGSLMPIRVMKPTDGMLALLERRIKAAEDEMVRHLNEVVYGDIQFESHAATLCGLKTVQEISEVKALGVLFPFRSHALGISIRA